MKYLNNNKIKSKPLTEIKRLFFSLVFMLLGWQVYAQPCLSNWHYRMPITINNTTNPTALVDYQLKFVLNTQSLITNGELRLDAGDLRFVNAAGVHLPFWIVNNTLNTLTTEIWVNVDNIPPLSNIDVFMFYGNSAANSVESGDDTFLHYDNFDGSALDFGKWTFCAGANGGTIPTVVNGEVSFSSSSSVYNHSIKSAQTFSGPITTEMKVNSATNGVALLGQITNSADGYGMGLEDQASVLSMRLLSLNSTSNNDLCFDLVNQTPINNPSAGAFQGLWSFSWSQPNEQLFSWPGGSETRIDFLDSASFNNDKNVMIGVFNNTGGLAVDYVYTRKYSPIVPSYVFNPFTELVDQVEVTSNSPICLGDTLKLFAPSFQGALYNWVGPNGFTSSDQNPIVDVSQFLNAGKFVLVVSAATNCSVVVDSTNIYIDSIAVGGLLLQNDTICEGVGAGILKLVNKTGNITNWESANTEFGPWSYLNSTNDSLWYNNLVETQYYRVLVQSGICGVDTSNTIGVVVDKKSDGGVLVASDLVVCGIFNAGQVHAYNQVGNISFWESSTDFGTTWTIINSTDDVIEYNGLTDTTLYRMQVKNGVCNAIWSDTMQIIVHPAPNVIFDYDTVCFGLPTHFYNQSTIANGTNNEFEWNFGDGIGSLDTNTIHIYNNINIHNVRLTVTSNFGCENSLLLPVNVYAKPEINFETEGQCIYSGVQFENLSSIEEGSMSYEWNFGDDSLSTITSPNHTYQSDGVYAVMLKATSNKFCVDSTIAFLQIYPLPLVDAGENVYVSYGFDTPLLGVSSNIETSVWSPGAAIQDVTSLTTLAKPLEETTYTLDVVSEYGCENFDKVTIRVIDDYKVIASNVVTPNDDGVNDTWEVINADSFNVINIHIYNKWGKEMFSVTEYKEGWDGTVNFDQLPTGAYYYYISFDESDKVYTGTINLLR